VVYGPGAEDGIVDPAAIEAIEVGCALGARVAVLADTISQREFVTSLGFGAQLLGVVSLEEIGRRLGDDFDPPGPFPPLPDAFTESERFKEAVRRFSDRTLKPVGSAIAPLLRSPLDRRGLPDVVFERAGRDGLGLATALVKPNVGSVVYAEDLGGRRLSFYAPQVWMRQRRILMPTAEIRGTHLNTAREFAEVQERIASGLIDLVAPVPVPLTELHKAHQAMWENRHAGATYVAVARAPADWAEDTRRPLSRLGHPRGGEPRSGARSRGHGICEDSPMSEVMQGGGARLAGRTVVLTGAAGNIGSTYHAQPPARGCAAGDDRPGRRQARGLRRAARGRGLRSGCHGDGDRGLCGRAGRAGEIVSEAVAALRRHRCPDQQRGRRGTAADAARHPLLRGGDARPRR
jgi:hypothetical protein